MYNESVNISSLLLEFTKFEYIYFSKTVNF